MKSLTMNSQKNTSQAVRFHKAKSACPCSIETHGSTIAGPSLIILMRTHLAIRHRIKAVLIAIATSQLPLQIIKEAV